MCGLVYRHSADGTPVNKLIWEQYEKQKSRGSQGFGVFNGHFTTKAAEEKRIKHWLKRDKNGSDMLLFHHRFPTSTVNVKRAAHPFNTGSFFGDTRYVLVHNGVIRKPDELRKAHEEMGIEYQSVLQDGTYNDSESLLWDVALYLEGKQDKLKAYGGIAFICIKVEKGVPTRLYFAKNSGRPLKLLRDESGVSLSSEGEGDDIEENMLYTYNYKLKRMTKKYLKVHSFDPTYVSNWESSRYTNHIPSNNACYQPNDDAWDEDEDRYGFHQEVYTDPYGFTWHGEDARLKRFQDSKDISDLDDRFEDMYEEYQYEEQDEDGVWHTFSDYVLINKDENRPSSTKPNHIGNIIPSYGIEPKDEEVNVKVFQTIGRAEGSYGDAYYHLEAELDMLRDGIDPSGGTWQERKEIKLLLAAIDAILNDEHYVAEDSKHPLWVSEKKDKFSQLRLIGKGAMA